MRSSYKYSTLFLLLFFTCENILASSSSILMTSQNSTNSIAPVNSIEASFDSASVDADKKNKQWSYEIDFTNQEIYTPTIFQSTIISGTPYRSAAINPTLFTTDDSLVVDFVSPSKWTFGFGYEYSRQQGGGTPNTFSNIGSLELAHKVDYGIRRKPLEKEVDNEDDIFHPSYLWKLKVSSGTIKSDAYEVLRADLVNVYAEPANSISQSSGEIELGWDVLSWITIDGSYQSFYYNSDPNSFSLLKNPKRGLPTSLNAFEESLTLTFHLGSSLDLEAKGNYSIAATSDQTATDEETYTLTYNADAFEFGFGFDHTNTHGAPIVDSTIVSLKLNF